MRQLTKVAALAASTAVGVEAVGDVWGYTTFSCTDEIVYRYDTVAEACADHGIKAYMDSDEGIFPQCRVCDDDDDDGGAGPVGGGTIIVGGSSCPTETHHRHGDECHADHVCGADQVGGGDEDCRTCGVGLVPNPGGTACQSCAHGESNTSGVCAADPCGIDTLDTFASDLGQIEKEGRERGRSIFCVNDKIKTDAWWTYASKLNVCAVSFQPEYWDSCWMPGGRDGPCDLASIHSHPYFTKSDAGKKCEEVTINESWAKRYNNAGMEFSSSDLDQDRNWRVDGYLVVSDRSCLKANRVTSGGSSAVAAGTCTQTPLPHTSWGTP